MTRAVIDRFGESGRARRRDRPRRARGARVQRPTADRSWLEGLLWPLVGERMAAWRERAQSARSPAPRALVVEVPLLFEAGMEGGFDATIAVIAPEAVRGRRARPRAPGADERGARQLSQDEKAARATYVVVNDGDVRSLEAKLSSVLDMLQR